MKAAVVVFPGSNCDRDAAGALARVTGRPTHMLWHKDTHLPEGLDLIVLPGGFSFGDYLRSGAMAARAPIMAAVREHAARGGYVLGICNGFQVLTEAQILPGALGRNQSLGFVCRPVRLTIENANTAFTRGYGQQTTTEIPVAHADGRYLADDSVLDRLEGEGQVVFRYLDNPNGSMRDIAGIMNASSNVMGMMPHPERVSDPALGRGLGGLPLFEGLASCLSRAAA